MSSHKKRRSGGSAVRGEATIQRTAGDGREAVASAGLLSTLMAGGTVGMADVSRGAARDEAAAACRAYFDAAARDRACLWPAIADYDGLHYAMEGRQRSEPDTIYADGGDPDVGYAAAEIGESILEGFMGQCGSGETGQPAAAAAIEDLGPLPRPAVSPLGLVTIGEDAR